MNRRTLFATIVSLLGLTAASLTAPAQHSQMPAGMTHDQHLAQMQKETEMKKRGAAAMGFDQDATIHHFILLPDGGSIHVDVRETTDVENREQIRTHLAEIAREFSQGVFEKPFETHAEVPSGVPVMQKLKDKITFSYEKSAMGGSIRIKTRNREALEAVHQFLRYQIREHATGDSLKVKR